MPSPSTQKELAIQEHSRRTERFVTNYAELQAHPYRSVFSYGRRRLDDLLERYLPKHGNGARLLDVGCGTGHYMAWLKARGFDPAGIDGSPEMLALARANNPGCELRLADVDKIPFPDASFDVVVCIEVLRYLPDARPCIREMARVLKPGGICLASATPILNLSGYWAINRLTTWVPLPGLSRLKQFFTTGPRLRREFEAAGFAAPEVRGFCFGPAVWIERIAPWAISRLLKMWAPFDAALGRIPAFREFANLFLVYAKRE